jgi:hypothetical protein
MSPRTRTDPVAATDAANEMPDPGASLDAADSTYTPAATDRSAEHPPPGPQVEQTLGKPGGGAKAAKAEEA